MAVRNVRSAARPALGRDAVVAAAIGIADEEGLAGLSMRRLAKELSVEAMSLYHYFPSKDELLSQMIDAVHSEIELPREDEHWKSGLRRSAISAYDAFMRHRWVAAVQMTTPVIRPAQTRRMEATLGALARAGLGPELTDRAYHALESHVVGFTLWIASMPFRKKGDLAALAETALRELTPDRFPHVAEHVRWHLAPRPPKGKTGFEFGLDLILDGIERLRPKRVIRARRTA